MRLRLNDGNYMPVLGAGTHRVEEQVDLASFIDMTISNGIYAFDTAQGYGNEKLLGEAFQQVGVERTDLYITTKLDDICHGYYEAQRAIEASLQSLKTQYIDLFLIHAPNSERMRNLAHSKGYDNDDYWIELNDEAWSALEEYKKKGYINSIGVSNFRKNHLETLIEHCSIIPAVNQIKMCIGSLPVQNDVMKFCCDKGISLCGYRIFGRRQLLDTEIIRNVAQKYGRSPSQVVINYLWGKGCTMVARMTKKSHLIENVHSFDFNIDETDRHLLETYISGDEYAVIKNPDTGIIMDV